MKLSIPTAVASLAGACVIAVLVYGVANQAPNRSLDEALAHGERPKAPDVTRELPALTGGGQRSLSSYKGKVVLLNFWASWCTGCEEEAALLEHAERRLKRDGATVLGVSFQDTTKDSLGFMKRYDVTYPSVHDVSGEFASAFGTKQLPESFLIDRAGHIADIERGPIGPAFVKRALRLAQS